MENDSGIMDSVGREATEFMQEDDDHIHLAQQESTSTPKSRVAARPNNKTSWLSKDNYFVICKRVGRNYITQINV